MKKTINLLQNRHTLPLKTLTAFIALLLFSPLFGQSTDPQGFNVEKERQKAIQNGIGPSDIEGYLKSLKKLREEKRGPGMKITIPPAESFTRKSGTDCVGDFENGAVSPWTGYTGSYLYYNLSSITSDAVPFYPGIVTGRHTIMNTGTDPIVPINMVHTGDHSLRLGNQLNGDEVERVARTVTVTNTCLSFYYALVFERPDHVFVEEPFFMFRIKDSIGNILDSFVKAASFDFSYYTQLNGRNDTIYRDWTKYTAELGCEYIGKTITIEFTTGDCPLGGHFGYAYIDDVCFENCSPCCKNCEDLINLPELYSEYPIITYKGSTDTMCCYHFNLPLLIAKVFKCSTYMVKIYDEANPGVIISSYSSTIPLDGAGSIFLPSMLDFCLGKSQFTHPKTLVIAFYDKHGNLICDSIKRVIEPCFSSSGCNCGNMFSDPKFAETKTIKKDTSQHLQAACCFFFTPFRDSSIIKCPIYGFRVYKDSTAYSPSYGFLDTLNGTTPIAGPGSSSSSDTFKFCISNSILTADGITMRIEYLDIYGRVICSKTEKVKCESTCCENVNVFIRKDTTETNPDSCCYRIEVWAFACNKTLSAELMKQNGNHWESAGIDTISITRPIFFDVCAPNGDTVNYTLFIKDSAGHVICTRQFSQSCPNCCSMVGYSATYVPPPPGQFVIDRCCWDINVFPAASMDCNIWYWHVYDSLHHVPTTWPPFALPSTVYQGRHCTGPLFAPNPAPGTTIIVTYCIDRYLAVYDNNGRLLCIKPIHLCCTRSYTNHSGGPQGPLNLEVAPNPFNEAFTMSLELPRQMLVGVKVLNSTGAVVYSANYGEQPVGIFTKDISLVGLPAGIYMLSVNDGQASIQIMKE